MNSRTGNRGAALITTLAIVVIVTALVIGFFSVIKTEQITSAGTLEAQRAKAFAEMATSHAIENLREAIDEAINNQKPWSSQPGKITVFNSNGTVDGSLSRLLHTEITATSGSIDLNKKGFKGQAPIIASEAVNATADVPLEVGWVNVFEGHSPYSSEDTPLVGRYAFWVDDETAKVNINTANGTTKGTNSSYGAGTPNEVSLTALGVGSTPLTQAQAEEIAIRTGALYNADVEPLPFNNIQELSSLNLPADFVAKNEFNLTHYNRSPELNFFGEPRIPLHPSFMQGTTEVDAFLGRYLPQNNSAPAISGFPSQAIYPFANQLPDLPAPLGGKLPQRFLIENISGNRFEPTSSDYRMGQLIARYLKGKNSRSGDIEWPQFPGSSDEGFAGKYTDRQIDSIALQILSLLKKQALAGEWRNYAPPYIMASGFLSGKVVRSLSTGPKANEVVVEITATEGAVNVKVWIEFINPIGSGSNFFKTDGWTTGTPYDSTVMNTLNLADSPIPLTPSPAGSAVVQYSAPSPMGGYWMDNLLKFVNQDGENAGVDLAGNNPNLPDPDPRNIGIYPTGGGSGTGPVPNVVTPALAMSTLSSSTEFWTPGEYRRIRNINSERWYKMRDGVTSLTISGGINIGLHTESGSSAANNALEVVPLESIRGLFTGETVGSPRMLTSSAKAAQEAAVLPIGPVTIGVPGTVTIHMQVADPDVNSFPADWVVTVNPDPSQITMKLGMNNLERYTNGENTIARQAAGGDPNSFWSPEQNFNIPKSRRFPSLGMFQYIKTGIFPDPEGEALLYAQQKGTPYRLFNFAPSTHPSQKTKGGKSYPDWAMLDLFTVPANYQKPPPETGTDNATPILLNSWGGATSGKINVNASILPSTSIRRTKPLEALFQGATVSGEPVTEEDLAAAVESYVRGLGRPLITPGEICNIPAIADFLFSSPAEGVRSRNDLVREVIGNTTTQSNTFTIWAVGQSIKKLSKNTAYGTFQSGDRILGEKRYKILVERTLDYGADGVPGNAFSPGEDGIVGTLDDPIDPDYHPALTYPLQHRYRILDMQEVTP